MQTMGNEARKTHCSHKELQCKQWVMKQGRLIVHTRSYNVTMGKEARKTHCSHKELQCKQWVMKQGRLIVTQGVTMQQWVMKQGRLIVHTKS
ncbi:hypothetical protein KSS87_020618 [Heliosperma pusillum]|nr:hypothetical protein KSS87_020618 [Heliosperma pusillum]KAH9607577.1 hypothetical protein KSS87_020618 [Heliosperma pusillum]